MDKRKTQTPDRTEENFRYLAELPAECLEDLSNYIDFLLYRRAAAAQRGENQTKTESYYGKLPFLPDGMAIQREMRNEWE